MIKIKKEKTKKEETMKKSYEYYHEGRTPAEDGELAAIKEEGYQATKIRELKEDFQTISSACLSLIAKKEIDAIKLAKAELANRGQDIDGTWIGFKAARRQK